MNVSTALYDGRDNEEDIHEKNALSEASSDTLHDTILSESVLKQKFRRFTKDGEYRDKFIFGFSIAWVAFVQGWTKGQIGPAFPDLLEITNTDLEQGSAYLTAFFTGKVIGSGSAGFVFDKCNTNLFISLTYLLHGISMASLPWCNFYEVMIAVFALTGIFNSFIDVALVTCSVRLFGTRNNTFVLITSLLLSFSSIMSPLMTVPFLLPNKIHKNGTGSDSDLVNIRDTLKDNYTVWEEKDSIYQTAMNETLAENRNKQVSLIYIPFTVTAACIILTSIMFCIFQIQGKNHIISKDGEKKPTSSKTKPKVIDIRNILCLTNLCLISALSSAIEIPMYNVLSIFCMQHLGWTSSKGAFAISFFFFSYMFGRIIGIAMTRFLRSISMLGIGSVLCALAFALFLLSTYMINELGIWVSTAVSGISISILFPSLLGWMNQKFQFVTGKMSSLILMTAYIGSMANPPILSFLMERYGDEWFAHVCFIESILLCFCFVTLACTKKEKYVKEDEIVVGD